jgi:hypothetical protein
VSDKPDKPRWSDAFGEVNVEFDVPPNQKPQPCPPELRAFAERERDLLIQYGLLKLPEQPKPAEQPEPPQGEQPDQGEQK